jgi:hypothetical protein
VPVEFERAQTARGRSHGGQTLEQQHNCIRNCTYGKTPVRENEKPTLLTRRQILASGAAMAGTIPLLPVTRAAAAPEPRTAKLRLTAGTRTLSVNGKPARVFGLTGPNGKPGITLSPGRALSHRSRESGRHIHDRPLARPVAALEAGWLSLAANAADPGG